MSCFCMAQNQHGNLSNFLKYFSVSLPVSNFAMYYSHTQARAKLPKKRRRVINLELPDPPARTAKMNSSLALYSKGLTLPLSIRIRFKSLKAFY